MQKLGAILLAFFLVPMALAEGAGEPAEPQPSEPQKAPESSGNETGNQTAAGNSTAEEEMSSEDSGTGAAGKTERPCRLYNYEGFNPQLSLYPLLGILTLDPDHCYPGIPGVPGVPKL